MSKRVADLLVETLQAAGVKRCYGIVGDTLNRIAHAIDESKIEWVSMRHEESGAFAAGAEAQLTGHLTACAGSCGPSSLYFINGLYEANRNRAPVILIASQIVRPDLGFQSIQEVDLVERFDQIADCAGLQRLSARIGVGERRNEHDRDLVPRGDEVTLQLEPVQARHVHVQHQASRLIQPARGEKVIR